MNDGRDWGDVRYRGDAVDVEELFETYRVGHYLDTIEESRRQQEEGIRERFMRDGIRLTQKLSPRIFGIFELVLRNLGLESNAEVFCLPDTEINAIAVLDVRRERDHALVGVTSGALEQLDDDELASVLGHEMGHFLFRNHRMNSLVNRDPGSRDATVLPPLGESLFLRWRKKAEVSADRVGLLASRDFAASARALMKCTFGLSDRNLNLNVETLLAQIDEIRGSRDLMEATFASHPLLPIRLKALQLFSRSAKAARHGFPCREIDFETDSELEDAVDELIRLTARTPHKPLSVAVMRAVALGGVLVLAADGDVSEHETKVLIELLHRYFTDEPEREIPNDLSDLRPRLAEAVAEVNRLGDESDKTFVISRLADIALADGALLGAEGAIILEIAQMLELPAKTAYTVMVGAAEAVGFRVDVKLNRAANELRKALRVGFGFAGSP